MDSQPAIHGRGAAENPVNRFEALDIEWDPEERETDPPGPATLYFRDSTRSIISTNDSPDVGFDASINPYRGCEHGCVYCYARPTHEYLGLSPGLDFESRILVKTDAPALLRRELSRESWTPRVLAMSGVTDCYQPAERKLRITRQCLDVLQEFRNPVGIVTKNRLVARDADVLSRMAEWQGAAVFVSVTSLDGDLAGKLEPRASRPADRLEAVRQLADAGVPVGVMVAPIIPAINDMEIPAILKAAAAAGARTAGFTMLRLPYAVKDLFSAWVERHFPDRKNKILNRIREIRGGKLNDANFGSRMRGEGEYAREIAGLFAVYRKRAGLDRPFPTLSAAHFRRPNTQGRLFE